jgi:hypothetical protein
VKPAPQTNQKVEGLPRHTPDHLISEGGPKPVPPFDIVRQGIRFEREKQYGNLPLGRGDHTHIANYVNA